MLKTKKEQYNMWELFKDKNTINEKNIIGFISFGIMVLFAIIDLATGIIYMGYVGGGQLEINDTIYNSFVMVTLGCFGISAFEKVKSK
tara:strand:- start:134 stop:397 length:264 start_codon:yes stop_codon:yes gene_type:complete